MKMTAKDDAKIAQNLIDTADAWVRAGNADDRWMVRVPIQDAARGLVIGRNAGLDDLMGAAIGTSIAKAVLEGQNEVVMDRPIWEAGTEVVYNHAMGFHLLTGAGTLPTTEGAPT